MNTFRLIQKSILLLLGSLLSLALFAQEQVYNFSFDTWSKSKGAWDLFPENASEKQKVWGTVNHGTSFLGINTTVPEKARPRPK